MPEALLAPTFLFRFSVPLAHCDRQWSNNPIELAQRYVLPSFGELEDRPLFGELRGGWNERGLFFTLRVAGKKQPPWCRATRLEDSDGLHLWIDTRDTHNIHRASRFCHRFILLPFGSGRRIDQPTARLVSINRAREEPKSIEPDVIKIRSERRIDGYLLQLQIPSAALTGFDPAEHPRLGFSYALIDREMGWQTFTVGAEFPFVDDPSLWGTLELVR